MNGKKQTNQPLFAEVILTGDEFRHSPSTHMHRTRFLKLVYPNDVTLILPCDINKHLFINTGEHLADGNIHHKAKGHRLIA